MACVHACIQPPALLLPQIHTLDYMVTSHQKVSKDERGSRQLKSFSFTIFIIFSWKFSLLHWLYFFFWFDWPVFHFIFIILLVIYVSNSTLIYKFDIYRTVQGCNNRREKEKENNELSYKSCMHSTSELCMQHYHRFALTQYKVSNCLSLNCLTVTCCNIYNNFLQVSTLFCYLSIDII